MSDFMTTIDEVAEVYDGPHATPKKIEQGPYFLSISSLENGALDLSKSAHLSEKDFIKWTKRVTPTVGDVLFSYETRLGDAALMSPNVKACLGRRMGLLRPNTEKVIPEYLLYAYLAPAFQGVIKSKTIHGATVNRIALKELPDFPIRVPPKEEQEEVVSVLKSIDSKIELNRQINQTLEQIAQAIFKSWFVDFEPVKAKIQAKQNGQDPERATMRAISGLTDEQLDQLSKEHDAQGSSSVAGGRTPGATLQQLTTTAALFPNELEDSEIGEIPKGWSYGSLNDLCELNANSWTKKNKPDEVWYVDLANTKNGIVEEIQYFTWEESPSRARRIVKPGDTIVGTVRPGNRSFALIGNGDKKLTASTGFAVLTPKKEEYREYIYIAATGDSNIERLAHLADGAAYPAVRPEVVTQMEVVVPNEEVFLKYSEMTHSLFLFIENNLQQAEFLASCRDTLLPKLLSGQVIGKRAQIQMEEIA